MATLSEDIDDDLHERLDRLRQERGVSLDQIINKMIRAGLDSLDAPPTKREPFKTRVFSGAEPLYNNPEELKALIAQIDEEEGLRKSD